MPEIVDANVRELRGREHWLEVTSAQVDLLNSPAASCRRRPILPMSLGERIFAMLA